MLRLCMWRDIYFPIINIEIELKIVNIYIHSTGNKYINISLIDQQKKRKNEEKKQEEERRRKKKKERKKEKEEERRRRFPFFFCSTLMVLHNYSIMQMEGTEGGS